MEKLQKGLDFLLDKYLDGKKNAKLIDNRTVEIDGVNLPLLPWRSERRFIELKNLVNDGSIHKISVMRVCRIEKKGTGLKDILYREFDLCEWILGSEITEIFTIQNGSAANIIAKLKNGIVCTIEAAATIRGESLDKHEIISQRGVACDRVVDTQVPQQSIYVFTDKKEPDTYLDVDFELFGLSVDEIAIVRQAFEAVKSEKLRKELTSKAEHISNLIKLSEKLSKVAEVEVAR